MCFVEVGMIVHDYAEFVGLGYDVVASLRLSCRRTVLGVYCTAKSA